MNKQRKTIALFGKAIPLTLIVALMVIGIASAALIANFFVVTTTVVATAPVEVTSDTVTCNDFTDGYCVQEIDVDNAGSSAILTELSTAIVGGDGIVVTYSLNGFELSDVDVDDLEELIMEPGATTLTMTVHLLDAASAGSYTITTTATIPEDVKLLTLDNKDSNWARTPGDGIKGYVIYTPEESTFNYYVYAKGLLTTTEYSLIYYADKPDRFVNWGGNNPGALIGTGTTCTDGTLKTPGTMAISAQDGNLPREPDANIAENFYGGAPDYYLTPHGAKLWLVPSSDYTAPALTAWNPTAYLFETDLIEYTETE